MAAPTPPKFKLRVKFAGKNMGKGLFLVDGNIKAKEIITAMMKPIKISRIEWENNLDTNGGYIKLNGKLFPHDIGFYHKKKWVFYDAKLVENTVYNKKSKQIVRHKKKRVPRWYRINHCSTPNIFPTYWKCPKTGKENVVFKSFRAIKIRKGQPVQLCFKYNDVPDHWK